MVGAERRQNTTQGAEGGKADQSDPAEGGGGGAVNRPAADPAGGRTPAKAVGRSVGAEVARAKLGRSERPSGEQANACKGGRLVGAFAKKYFPVAKGGGIKNAP